MPERPSQLEWKRAAPHQGSLVARSTYTRRNCFPVDEAGLTGPGMSIATLAKGSVESLVMPMGTFGTGNVEVV